MIHSKAAARLGIALILTVLLSCSVRAQTNLSIQELERKSRVFDELIKKQNKQRDEQRKKLLAEAPARKEATFACMRAKADVYAFSDMSTDVAASFAYDACVSQLFRYAVAVAAQFPNLPVSGVDQMLAGWKPQYIAILADRILATRKEALSPPPAAKPKPANTPSSRREI